RPGAIRVFRMYYLWSSSEQPRVIHSEDADGSRPRVIDTRGDKSAGGGDEREQPGFLPGGSGADGEEERGAWGRGWGRRGASGVDGRWVSDWSSDVGSSDVGREPPASSECITCGRHQSSHE